MEENKTQQALENEELNEAVAKAEEVAEEAPVEQSEGALEGEALVEAVAEIDTTTEDAALTEDGELKYEITTDGEMSGLTEQQRRRAEIFDKITTGILAFLLASPFLILLYILLWFILKN